MFATSWLLQGPYTYTIYPQIYIHTYLLYNYINIDFQWWFSWLSVLINSHKLPRMHVERIFYYNLQSKVNWKQSLSNSWMEELFHFKMLPTKFWKRISIYSSMSYITINLSISNIYHQCKYMQYLEYLKYLKYLRLIELVLYCGKIYFIEVE